MIAEQALDVFGTSETAQHFLRVGNFDGTHKSALELIREGRGGRVLSRIDEMRTGFRG